MIEAALAVLPGLGDVASLLPLLLGGGGLASAVLGLLPNLRTYAMIGLGVLLALSMIGLLWYRDEYESEKAGRIADAAAAQTAADAKIASAKRDADKREATLQIEIAAHRTTADLYRDMITNAPPSTCAPSVGARAASRGLSVLLADPGATGAPAAQ